MKIPPLGLVDIWRRGWYSRWYGPSGNIVIRVQLNSTLFNCAALVCFVFRAAVLGCINSQWPDKYGHYREAKYTQTKHHWFWKVWPLSHQGVRPNSDFMLQIHCPRDYWGCLDCHMCFCTKLLFSKWALMKLLVRKARRSAWVTMDHGQALT